VIAAAAAVKFGLNEEQVMEDLFMFQGKASGAATGSRLMHPSRRAAQV